MVTSEAGLQRTRTAILDAAALILGRRPDAAMAEIAEEAGVGRATLYRHFPTRESLQKELASTGIAELAEALEAANLDELKPGKAIARIVAVAMRNAAKYAAVINPAPEVHNPPDTERAVRPVREVIERGIREGVLRDDLRADTLLSMFAGLMMQAVWLTIGGTLTPEEAGEGVLAIFLDGARRTE